jgi:valyl-tRNA synthetase
MGRDVRISDKRIQGYRFFINKIWNAGKFVLSNIEGFDPRGVTPDPSRLGLAEKWILTELNRTVAQTRKALEEYRFNDAADVLYQFTWHTFCDWYIELTKSVLGTEEGNQTRWVLHHVLRAILELMHPIIPFVTEEIWQRLPGRDGESIVKARYPSVNPGLDFPGDDELMGYIIEVISGVRSIRGETGISPGVLLDVVIRVEDQKLRGLLQANSVHIRDLARTRQVGFIADESERPRKCALAVRKGLEVYVPLEGVIDIDKELDRLAKQMGKVAKELDEKRRKLSNPNFVAKAKKEVVDEQVRIKAGLEFELASLQKAHALLKA